MTAVSTNNKFNIVELIAAYAKEANRAEHPEVEKRIYQTFREFEPFFDFNENSPKVINVNIVTIITDYSQAGNSIIEQAFTTFKIYQAFLNFDQFNEELENRISFLYGIFTSELLALGPYPVEEMVNKNANSRMIGYTLALNPQQHIYNKLNYPTATPYTTALSHGNALTVEILLKNLPENSRAEIATELLQKTIYSIEKYQDKDENEEATNEMVNALINNKADLDVTVQEAARQGHFNIFKCLLNLFQENGRKIEHEFKDDYVGKSVVLMNRVFERTCTSHFTYQYHKKELEAQRHERCAVLLLEKGFDFSKPRGGYHMEYPGDSTIILPVVMKAFSLLKESRIGVIFQAVCCELPQQTIIEFISRCPKLNRAVQGGYLNKTLLATIEEKAKYSSIKYNIYAIRTALKEREEADAQEQWQTALAGYKTAPAFDFC